jgi:uncharacterized protein YggE
MRERKLWIVVTTSAALLLLVGVLAFAQVRLAPPVARAQTDAQAVSALPRTITVVGEGKVRIKPDVAQTTIGVDVRQSTVKEASAEAKQVMDEVLKVLKAQGIEDKDIQTSGFSIWVETPPYGPEGEPQGKTIYHVTNQVSVTIRDLDKVGTVLDAAIEAGANNIYGVNFSIADPTPVESEARNKAVADAQAKAQELARLNSVQLGDVVSVSEVIGGKGGYYTGGFSGMPAALGLGGGGGAISPGELELSLQLEIVYAVQ